MMSIEFRPECNVELLRDDVQPASNENRNTIIDPAYVDSEDERLKAYRG